MSSGYCLRVDLNDDQKSRFRYRKDIFAEIYINFSQVDSEMEDLLDTRHWEIQLQAGMQIVILNLPLLSTHVLNTSKSVHQKGKNISNSQRYIYRCYFRYFLAISKEPLLV